MIHQTAKRHLTLRTAVAFSAILLLLATMFTAVTVMAIRQTATASERSDNKRPMLTVAPTPSTTTSITNGVYIQDPKTKEFKKVNQDTGKAKPTAGTSSIGSAAAVKPTSLKSLAGLSLYVDPSLASQGRQTRIASQPTGQWFGGWNVNVQADVSRIVTSAARRGTVPTLVAYNIPSRDCGSYSAGGAGSSLAYREWIKAFANGIGTNQAIVILEPDALAGLDCLSSDAQRQRLSDIAFAVNSFASTGASTYIDAGNYSWQSTSTMAQRLKAANVASARGFSLNVSGYGWTDKSITYGQQLTRLVGGSKGFVIDTSRNGNGPAPGNQWCNPRGRSLGESPTTNTGVSGLDAYLWVKVPGESDGTCDRNEPGAGQWWDEMANELIGNAA